MSFYKYSLWLFGVLVGSEIIVMCFRKICLLLQKKYEDMLHDGRASIFTRVVFFPDQGIIRVTSTDTNFGSVNNSPFPADLTSDPKRKQAKITKNSYLHKVETSPFFLPQLEYSQSSNQPHISPHLSSSLKNSTSLIHLVNVLDSAKASLIVCLNILTCRDLIDAVVRAKTRGVQVRVLVDGKMCTETCQTTMDILYQNNVPARPSHPPLMMHHKFAVVDAPTVLLEATTDQPQARGNVEKVIESRDIENSLSRRREDIWNFGNVSKFLSEFCYKASHEPQKERNCGILMTGSFNWTWSAVVSNHENVVITNHPILVQHFVQEFEALWSSGHNQETRKV